MIVGYAAGPAGGYDAGIRPAGGYDAGIGPGVLYGG